MAIDVDMPSRSELTAWRLRRRQGLSDSQVAQLLGTARETANRRIRRATSKIRRLVEICGADCPLLEGLLN